MRKVCTKCFQEKDLIEFSTKSARCKPCRAAKCREYYKTDAYKQYARNQKRRYYHTLSGYMVVQYENMRKRILGKATRNAPAYVGLPLMPRREYYKLCLANPTYKKLFENYKRCRFATRYAPSVDRIDSTKGYTLDNIQFITHSENSYKGCHSYKRHEND